MTSPRLPTRRPASFGRQARGNERLHGTGKGKELPHPCAATGDTLEEVETEMRAAIAFHLEGLAKDVEPIPEPSGPGVYVERKTAAA